MKEPTDLCMAFKGVRDETLTCLTERRMFMSQHLNDVVSLRECALGHTH